MTFELTGTRDQLKKVWCSSLKISNQAYAIWLDFKVSSAIFHEPEPSDIITIPFRWVRFPDLDDYQCKTLEGFKSSTTPEIAEICELELCKFLL